MNKENQRICFVIMPFRVREADLSKYYNDSSHWNEVYNGLIIPAIKEVGLQAQRDDDDYSTRLVGEGVWLKIEQADIVLCDMSSHNPNVHLELGWAMRADKKIVLIKDEITTFNFDLNQYYTYEYSSKLQPTVLFESVKSLSKVIKSTLTDTVSNYSMVSKLNLQKQATDASSKGNLEISLLQEVIGEIRSVKRQAVNFAPTEEIPFLSLNIKNKTDLPELLIGTTWRKKNGLEEITFISVRNFAYYSVGTQQWLKNDVSFDLSSGDMKLFWRHDNFISYCKFDSRYSLFTEQDGTKWFLIAKEPYIHPSLLTK